MKKKERRVFAKKEDESLDTVLPKVPTMIPFMVNR
jgi:hypothetical protein